MTSNINYKDTVFERDNITAIRGETTFKTLQKLQNEIKSNAKVVYSNISGGAHNHLGLVLTDVQCALISPATFVFTTHMGPLVIPDNMTAHAKSNMQNTHTEEVRLFREVTGVKQALIQKFVVTI